MLSLIYAQMNGVNRYLMWMTVWFISVEHFISEEIKFVAKNTSDIVNTNEHNWHIDFTVNGFFYLR